MKFLMYVLTISWILLSASGCIKQSSNTDSEQDEYKGIGCEQDRSLCEGSEVCTLVDPCGSPCDSDDLNEACPQVCVEVYACIEPLREGERCNQNETQCAENLSCLADLDAGCEPSFCEGDMCTQDCIEIYTCQETPLEPCNPQGEENTCTDGKVCGIADFVDPCENCDVDPTPIFGCIVPLVEGQVCAQIYSEYGYDQCAEGLACKSGPNECTSCDEDGNCMATCPTPPPYCQPEPEPAEEN